MVIQPELAHCSDLGAFIVKKYAPAAERARKLVPSKNKRFAEFARVVAGRGSRWRRAPSSPSSTSTPTSTPSPARRARAATRRASSVRG